MLKKARLLTHPTLARRDAPCPRQGRSSEADPRFTFHASRFTVPESDARTLLADFFSILLALSDGHIGPAMLTGINLVRTEQFVLAKLFEPMGQPPRHSC